MAEVTLIDFSYLNRLALSTSTEVGPVFKSRLGPVIEKAKKLSILQHPRSISVTSAILISKVQPCPTSSVSVLYRRKQAYALYCEYVASMLKNVLIFMITL